MSNHPSAREPIGIIISHGDLAGALLKTAKGIIGRVEGCFMLSGSELSSDVLVGRIREILDRHEGRNAVLFVDYFGGSMCINSVRAMEGRKGVKIVSGINLPVLLDFMTKREAMEFEEMVDHLIVRGRESIRVIDV